MSYMKKCATVAISFILFLSLFSSVESKEIELILNNLGMLRFRNLKLM